MRIMILHYFFCMALTYEFLECLAETIVARKWSQKCNTLRCTSCHCVVTQGLPGHCRYNTNSGIKNDVQWRSLNFWKGT